MSAIPLQQFLTENPPSAGQTYRTCDCGLESCSGWMLVPAPALASFTRNERSDIARKWRTDYIAGLSQELRADWSARLAAHEEKRAAARVEYRLFTDDKWTVLVEFAAANSLTLPQYLSDMVAYVIVGPQPFEGEG